MDDRHRAIERAMNIADTVEWSGDMRVNMTTALGAARVLAKRVKELEEEVADWEKANEDIHNCQDDNVQVDLVKQLGEFGPRGPAGMGLGKFGGHSIG
ncbi:hypothetical protein CMI37_26460 [Candidatus Pacearchaeota archaeon]|nr:hypothetical protein [Candidatus Pacearchaeota archaeon]|tara:strand:+ start:222 stop:515 length:294 start_codon:yes stop_codon:yes gene_type:complete